MNSFSKALVLAQLLFLISTGAVFSQQPDVPLLSRMQVTFSSEKPSSLKNWFARMDTVLDATLAATLAGLALAAAAFLSSSESSLRGTIGHLTAADEEGETKALIASTKNKLKDVQAASRVLLFATFAFIVALIDNLTIDPVATWGDSSDLLSAIDSITSFGPMAFGVACLIRGTYRLLPREV